MSGAIVRAHASRRDVVEAVDRHQWELAIRWTEVQDGLVVDTPGLVRTINPPVKVAFANGVYRVRMEPDEVGDAVRESTAAFREADVPALWWGNDLSRPLDAGTALAAHGWRPDESMPWMATPIDRIVWPETPAGLEIARVTGDEQHRAWLEGMTRGFSMTSPERGAMTALASAVGYGEDAPWIRWAGFVDGRAVASAGLMLAGGVAGIYNVATVPEARRRGIGAAMTARAVAAGRERGHEVAVLGASPLGRGVYERMGFAEVCRERLFLLEQRRTNAAAGNTTA
jgi:ribosomal protein S18 acetylase RimI-like enzyme